MKKFNSIDKFKYDFMKNISLKKTNKFIFQSNEILDTDSKIADKLHKAEKKLHKVIEKFEEAKSQLEFKFEELKEFGQIIKLKNKMIFFIAPDKHELIYQWLNFTSTVSNDFDKVIEDSYSSLLSLKHKK